MIFKVNRKNLASALKTVSACVQSRCVLPIINNALFEAGEGKLKITCTNLVQRITVTIDADAPEQGTTTIPAKKLLSILDALAGNEVTLDCNTETFHTELSCGRSRIKLLGLNPKDFPNLAEINREYTVQMESAKLRNIIEHTQYAISVNEARKVMEGMLFDVSGNQIVGVAMDGKRCAVSQVDLASPVEQDFSRIIPADALSFLRNINQDKVYLVFDDGKHLVAFSGDIVFESKLIEGNYPNWRQVVPPAFNYKAEIPASDFLAKLNIMSMICAESGTFYVDLTFRENSLVFHADSASSGSADDMLEIKTDGIGAKDELALTFNPLMLADAVKTCNDAAFRIEINNGQSPVKLDFGKGSFCVLMPIRKK